MGTVPHQGFLSASWGAQAIGAKLISTLTGRGYGDFDVRRSLDEAVRLVERQRATIIWGITTFVRRFVVRAQELGADLGSVRMAMVMGEPCPPGMREDIRDRLEFLGSAEPRISNGYGFTEMQGPAMECVELGPRHIAAPEQFHFEVVDVETGEPVAEGTPGLLLMSHLNRRGTVLLRYRVGDIVAIEPRRMRSLWAHRPSLYGRALPGRRPRKDKGHAGRPAGVAWPSGAVTERRGRVRIPVEGRPCSRV